MKYLIIFVILSLVGAVAGYRYGYSQKTLSSQFEKDGTSAPQRRTLTSRIVRVDPSEVFSQLNAAREFKDRRATLLKLEKDIDSFSEEEIRAALANLAEVEDGQAREELTILLLQRMAKIDFREAFQLSQTGDYERRVRQAVFTDIMKEAAAISPGNALVFWNSAKEQVKNSYRMQQGLIEVFQKWRTTNFSEAFDRVADLEHPGDRHTAMGALFSYDPQQPGEREKLLEFAEDLPHSEKRTQALAEIAKSWSRAEQDLDKIETWLSGQEFSNDMERAKLERAIAEPRLERDPESAAKWLLSRATDETYSGHLGEIVGRWSRMQPDACAKWLRDFDLGPQTDEAVAQLAEHLDDDDPSYAFEWARAIHDPETRRETMGEIMQVWNRMDQTKARQFLKDTELDQSERDRLGEWLK